MFYKFVVSSPETHSRSASKKMKKETLQSETIESSDVNTNAEQSLGKKHTINILITLLNVEHGWWWPKLFVTHFKNVKL